MFVHPSFKKIEGVTDLPSYQEEKTENGGKRKKGKSDKDNGRDTRSAGPLFTNYKQTSPEA